MESSNKIEHSVKLPYIYKIAKKVLKLYCDKQGSLQNLIYDRKNQACSKRLQALLSRVISNYSLLEEALQSLHLFKEQPKFDRHLAIILASELMGTDGPLRGDCKPVCVINTYEKKFRLWLSKNSSRLSKACQKFNPKTSCPRYVRINTLLISAEEVHQKLEELGWKRLLVDTDREFNYQDFLQRINKLKQPFYMDDFHVPDLLIFTPREELWHTDLYKSNFIILQDKASCLPPIISDVKPGDVVIDACAAPGNKTSLLASLMKNDGKIIAVDMNKERFSRLKSFLESRGATCVETLNEDFTSMDPADYSEVKVILVDPSCSSSGASFHADHVSKERLHSLSIFQQKLLTHALSFPSVETVVYSTCSLYKEENEAVVEKALSLFQSSFELERPSLLGWENFGMPSYSFGHLCLRTKSKIDKCQGFFVAKFKRKGSSSVSENSTKKRKIKKKREREFDDEINLVFSRKEKK